MPLYTLLREMKANRKIEHNNMASLIGCREINRFFFFFFFFFDFKFRREELRFLKKIKTKREGSSKQNTISDCVARSNKIKTISLLSFLFPLIGNKQ